MRDTLTAAGLSDLPWAILPDAVPGLDRMLRAAGGDVPSADLVATCEAAAADGLATAHASAGGTVRRVAGLYAAQVGRVAVLPLYGLVFHRPNVLTVFGLAASAEQFARAHAELVADPGVAAIVWDVSSPGGTVAGMTEAAAELYALRGRKKTVAVSNAMMASAAYWLGSAADEVVAAPSSLTGSIGVIVAREDRTGANEKAGIKVTHVYAGKSKAFGHPDHPMSAAEAASAQRQVDDFYGRFVADVARHRNVSQTAVREGYGEGDVLTAGRALAARLVDRVETLDQVVRRLSGRAGTRPATPRGASDSVAVPTRMAAALQRQRAAEAA